MGAQMVRKQIYISSRQEALLKRLAQAKGLSEAEIIRQALDREISGEAKMNVADSTASSALEAFIQLAQQPRGEVLQGEPYHWKRDEIYAEREARWNRAIAEKGDDASRVD